MLWIYKFTGGETKRNVLKKHRKKKVENESFHNPCQIEHEVLRKNTMEF